MMLSETLRNASFIDPEHLKLTTRISKTWKLDTKKKRVTSEMIDEIEAVKQAVYIHLHVPNKSAYIHTNGFGSKFASLYGKDIDLVIAKLPDIIKDALAWDERVLDVTDFEFEKLEHNRILRFSCSITSSFGDFRYEDEINV